METVTWLEAVLAVGAFLAGFVPIFALLLWLMDRRW